MELVNGIRTMSPPQATPSARPDPQRRHRHVSLTLRFQAAQQADLALADPDPGVPVDRVLTLPGTYAEDELYAFAIGEEGGEDKGLDEAGPEPPEPTPAAVYGAERGAQRGVGADPARESTEAGQGGDELGEGNPAHGLGLPGEAQRVEEEDDLPGRRHHAGRLARMPGVLKPKRAARTGRPLVESTSRRARQNPNEKPNSSSHWSIVSLIVC